MALVWTELGGPTVVPPQAKGFGIGSIHSGLGGRKRLVSIAYERSGLHCRINIVALRG